MWRFGQITFGDVFFRLNWNYIISKIIFSNRYLAERQFRDTSFSRKSFSRIEILPNAFFSNLQLAECHFPESSFSQTSFFRKYIEPNEHHCSIKTWLWLLLLLILNSYGLLNNTVRCGKYSASYNFRKMTFGQKIFRENDVLLNVDSWKWHSAIQRFGKVTFGWTTIRKNVIRHYKVSVIPQFGYVTIRSNYVRWCFFFRRNNDSVIWRFGKTTIRWTDVSVKWGDPFSKPSRKILLRWKYDKITDHIDRSSVVNFHNLI